MDKLELKALGKINLGLDILGRRDNGYHDVRMVMQTVYLYDRVTLAKKAEPGIEIETNLSYLPVGENNIAYKAAALLTEEFGIQEGLKIRLDKHIPVAAGMAGGSSNAAAVLFGMNRMFGLGLSMEGLMERGVTLGADVPYCIMRGTVLAEGDRRDPDAPAAHAEVPCADRQAPLSASTKTVYEKIDREGVREHPDIDAILAGLEAGDLHKVAAGMGNVLEQVMLPEYPVLGRIKEIMREAGALNAMMSGSGPTVFGIFDSRGKAKAAAARLKRQTPVKQAYVTNVHNVRRK